MSHEIRPSRNSCRSELELSWLHGLLPQSSAGAFVHGGEGANRKTELDHGGWRRSNQNDRIGSERSPAWAPGGWRVRVSGAIRALSYPCEIWRNSEAAGVPAVS